MFLEAQAKMVFLKSLANAEKIANDQDKTVDETIAAYKAVVADVEKVFGDAAKAKAFVDSETEKLEAKKLADEQAQKELTAKIFSGEMNLDKLTELADKGANTK